MTALNTSYRDGRWTSAYRAAIDRMPLKRRRGYTVQTF